jgi:DNA recombination protein RmuC
VVLFLPGDQFLSGALEFDPTLIDRAISRKILLTTPASLIALLKAAAYGWRQESVSKNADVIASLGRDLHDRVATFAEHIESIGTGLKSALTNYNKAVGSYEGALLPGARKLAELGAKGAKTLPTPAPLEIAPREVTKRA